MKAYTEKIERILNNKLGSVDYEKAVEDVKTWLCCEWQCSEMPMEEYIQLRDMIEPIAQRMIKEL